VVRTAILATLLIATASAGAFAQDGADLLDEKDVPQAVLQQHDCGGAPGVITRRAFSGGFVFALPCPGNHANQMHALVFAHDSDGGGARLVRFPTPRANIPWNELANVRWFAKTGEIAQLSVDPESRPCRVEARWRLDGAKAALVHWRQTADCEGRRGWVTLVNRK
jgi:hypothetical protein